MADTHVGYITAGAVLCVGAIMLFIHSWRKERRLTRRCIAIGGQTERQSRQWTQATQGLAGLLAGPAEKKRISRRLVEAGYFLPRHVDLFLLIKCAVVAVALVPCLLWLRTNDWQILQHPLDALKGLGLIFLAVRTPDWILADMARQRRNRIAANLPQAFDLLTICIESGMTLEDSLFHMAEDSKKIAPEIAAEFMQTRSELLITTDRQEALSRLGSRTKVKDLEILSATLIQSIRYGTPLADALRLMAKECRARQIAALEEKAGAMSARVGVPLIVLILIPLVIMMLTPAIIALMRTLGSTRG